MNLDQLKEEIQKEVPAVRYLGFGWRLCMLLKRTPEGEAAFLERKGAAKQLCDEVIPIGYFCNHIFGVGDKGVSVKLVLGNQSHDAIVSGSENMRKGISYFEVTSIEDEDVHKQRMELLERGHSNREYLVSERLQQRSALLDRIIRKKASKEYPNDTALIIYSKETIGETEWMYLINNINNDLLDLLKKFRLACILDPKKIHVIFKAPESVSLAM